MGFMHTLFYVEGNYRKMENIWKRIFGVFKTDPKKRKIWQLNED